MELSGDDRVITCRVEVERASTFRPWSRTDCGSRASACCTRLLTLIVAWSGSVPISNDTVTRKLPESVALDSR